jgi:hypothetical protein
VTPNERWAWKLIGEASFGNEWSEPIQLKVCVIATRYGGGYEGGAFAAVPVNALTSEAFGDDLSAASWWHYNRQLVGVGNTPNEALLDWYTKIGHEHLVLNQGVDRDDAHARILSAFRSAAAETTADVGADIPGGGDA